MHPCNLEMARRDPGTPPDLPISGKLPPRVVADRLEMPAAALALGVVVSRNDLSPSRDGMRSRYSRLETATVHLETEASRANVERIAS